MIVALRVEINAIAALILLLLLFNMRHKAKVMLDERLYHLLLIVTILYDILSTATWVFDGLQGKQMHFLLEFINVC